MSDLAKPNDDEWDDLVERHLRGELSELEKERLAESLDSDALLRQKFVRQATWDTELSEVIRAGGDRQSELETLLASNDPSPQRHANKVLRALLAMAAVTILALSALLFEEKSQPKIVATDDADASTESSIAQISGLSGSLIWTGDRGEIVRDISIGTTLTGGTIEGLAPDSWFELQFNDDSKVMISGTSMLTFADDGQKRLRLREGRLSADVAPQPRGKPMLIRTRTALLSVLGTQFELEAELVSTALNVSEGIVRMRRLSDGIEVDVPAQHSAIADDDHRLIPERVPESTDSWKTQFDARQGYYGKWQPANGDRQASLRAIPLVPPAAPKVTLYLAGLSVDRSNNSPVVVRPGSRFRVRGRLNADARVFFGIRVSYPNGKFAGMFRGDLGRHQPLAVRNAKGEFEEVFELENFTVDPSVAQKQKRLAAKPDDLLLDGVWAFTNMRGPSGLVLTEVEMIPPQIEAR